MQSVVVVVDAGSAAALKRTVLAVRRTAPAARTVVALRRGRAVPAGLGRGASFVSDATEDAVRRRVGTTPPDATITLTTDVVLADGWLEALLAPLAGGAELSAVRGVPTTALLAQRGGLTGERVAAVPVDVVVPGVTLTAAAVDDGRPLVSAVLIVKDEQDCLADCLAAVAPFADEVVVYDTGSTDDTPRIAERCGARVVRGTWDDHFGNARNRALEHATGHWVFSVDADELVCGDADALRSELRGHLAGGDVNVVGLTVRSAELDGGAAATEGIVGRVFRADQLHWRGALHEQLTRRDGTAELPVMRLTSSAVLDHSGYTPLRWTAKDKTRRNLDIATAAVSGGTVDDPSKTWTNLGRSLVAAGRHVEAVDALAHVDVEDPRAALVVEAGEAGFWAATTTGDLDEGRRWLDVLARRGENPERLVFYRGRLRAVEGDVEGGLALMTSAVEHVDAAGRRFNPGEGLGTVLEALVTAGRPGKAGELLVAATGRGESTLPLSDAVKVLDLAGRPLADYLAVLPAGELKSTAGQLLRCAPEFADGALETLWERGEESATVLVSASMVASGLTVARALVWSQRLRAAGFAEGCPLRRIAVAAERSASDRALAAAVCWEGFGEDDVRPALDAALAEVDDADVETFLAALQPLAPGLAGQLEPVGT